MKAITTYVATDGKRFTDADAAALYEKNLQVVDGVKALLAKQGKTKVGKTKSGKEITRYLGLKKVMEIITQWEDMKTAETAAA